MINEIEKDFNLYKENGRSNHVSRNKAKKYITAVFILFGILKLINNVRERSQLTTFLVTLRGITR